MRTQPVVNHLKRVLSITCTFFGANWHRPSNYFHPEVYLSNATDVVVQGAGSARVMSHPSHGNIAMALLARNHDRLDSLAESLRTSTSNPIATFLTDTRAVNTSKAFSAIRSHGSFQNPKLKVAIFSVKHSLKNPFLNETHNEFVESLSTYVGGAIAFSQEVVKMLFEQHSEKALADGGLKKGTLIFTDTLGALRTNANFAAYGARRSAVRILAQSLAKEYSAKGIHVAQTIANGGIQAENGEAQERGQTMSAEAVW